MRDSFDYAATVIANTTLLIFSPILLLIMFGLLVYSSIIYGARLLKNDPMLWRQAVPIAVCFFIIVVMALLSPN
jgi:Na+-driven multidrug efflux pump